MRMQGKIDANQPSIVKALRSIGASVQSLASVGSGTPDVLVGWNGANYLFEIKNGLLIPSKRVLTPMERQWHEAWRGQVGVVETLGEIWELLAR